MTIEAMRQALEALCDFDYDKRQSAITALRAAIEQAEQPRQWQGLTGGEVAQLTAKHSQYPFALTAAIEAGLTDPDLGECVTDYGDATEGVLRFAELVAAAERESCAQVAEKMLRHYTQAVTGVPEAIRARGEKNEP